MAHRWKPFLGAEPATSLIGYSRANIADDRDMVLEMGVGPYTRISHVKISVILQIEKKKNTLASLHTTKLLIERSELGEPPLKVHAEANASSNLWPFPLPTTIFCFQHRPRIISTRASFYLSITTHYSKNPDGSNHQFCDHEWVWNGVPK